MKKGLRPAAFFDNAPGRKRTDPDLMKKGLRPPAVQGPIIAIRTDPDLMKKGLRLRLSRVSVGHGQNGPRPYEEGIKTHELAGCLGEAVERTQTL